MEKINPPQNHIFYIMVITFSLIFFLISCQQQKEPQKIIRPVRYITVEKVSGSMTKTFSGVVKPKVETNLSFLVDGQIKNINVSVGDFVKKGQLLMNLDAQQYQLKVDEANAQLFKAIASAKNAKSLYERYQKLHKDGAIAESELDDAKASAEATLNQVISTKKVLDFSQLRVGYTKLYAPSDGYISEISCSTGEILKAGDKTLKFISAKQNIVQVYVPESYIAKIYKDEPVKIRISYLKEKEFGGKVTEIGVASYKTTITYPVKVSIINATENIKPGMSAEVTFQLQEKEKRIIVPINAVGEDEKGRYVYILKADKKNTGKIIRRNVVLGDITANGIEIKKGLKAGEKVVTAGISNIKEGQIVRLETNKDKNS